MKAKKPPYPDPYRAQLLSQLIDKYREHLLLICLKEGITKQDIIDYTTRLCALKHLDELLACLLYTSPSPRDATLSRMPSSA